MAATATRYAGGMLTTSGRVPFLLACATLALLSGGGCRGCMQGCTHAGFSPSEGESQTIDGVDIDLEAHALTDYSGFNNGCTTDGYGIEVTIEVDDRGEVSLGRRSGLPEEPSDDDLEDVLSLVEVRLAKNHQHVAGRFNSKWSVYHLLAAGPPFSSATTDWSKPSAPDLDALPAALEVALTNVRDDLLWHNENMWRAMAASPTHEPLDLAMLERWPSSTDWVHAAVMRRAAASSGVSARWRKDARTRAFEVMKSDDDMVRSGGEVVVVLDGGKAAPDLLDQILVHWPDGDGHYLLVQHVATAPAPFRARLEKKALGYPSGFDGCRASIVLAHLDPAGTSCADVESLCTGDGARIEGSCQAAKR
jgi:hypothetical protein